MTSKIKLIEKGTCSFEKIERPNKVTKNVDTFYIFQINGEELIVHSSGIDKMLYLLSEITDQLEYDDDINEHMFEPIENQLKKELTRDDILDLCMLGINYKSELEDAGCDSDSVEGPDYLGLKSVKKTIKDCKRFFKKELDFNKIK